MQCLGIANSFSSRTQLRLRHNFKKRRSRTVQVDAGVPRHNTVHRLACILFEMRTRQMNSLDVRITIFGLDSKGQLPANNNRQLKLADLITLR